MPETRAPRMASDRAEAIAVQILAFLGDRPEELGRFLALAGLGPDKLRAAASDPGFLGGLVDFILQDEALLLSFAENARLPPASVGEAARALGLRR